MLSDNCLSAFNALHANFYTQTVPTPESTMKSSPDIDEIPEFTEEEVERAIKRMKRHKAQGVDGITSEIIKLGGPIVLTYLRPKLHGYTGCKRTCSVEQAVSCI